MFKKKRRELTEMELTGICAILKNAMSTPNSRMDHYVFTLSGCLKSLGIPVEHIDLPAPPRPPKP